MEKKTLSITINPQTYQLLQQKIGKGKISAFAERLFLENLAQEEEELAQAYQEAYQPNSALWKLSQQWEQAQNHDWINLSK